MGVLQAGSGGEHSTAEWGPPPTPGRVPSRELTSTGGSVSPGVSLSHPARVRPVWPLLGVPSEQPGASRPCTAGAGGRGLGAVSRAVGGQGGQHLERSGKASLRAVFIWPSAHQQWVGAEVLCRASERAALGDAVDLRSCQPQAGAAVRAGPALAPRTCISRHFLGHTGTTVPGSRLPLCILQLPSLSVPWASPRISVVLAAASMGPRGRQLVLRGQGSSSRLRA